MHWKPWISSQTEVTPSRAQRKPWRGQSPLFVVLRKPWNGLSPLFVFQRKPWSDRIPLLVVRGSPCFCYGVVRPLEPKHIILFEFLLLIKRKGPVYLTKPLCIIFNCIDWPTNLIEHFNNIMYNVYIFGHNDCLVGFAGRSIQFEH